ncbi:MAG: hypothetical protein VCA36_13660 [Opitutales bacterium]
MPEKLDAETNYVYASLSHTRAMRDKLYDELSDPITLPAELPSQITAKEGEVYLQIPTGKDVKVKATILRVLDPSQLQDENFGKLEEQITPMIRQGFACGFLYADTAKDLLRGVTYDLPAAVNKLDVMDQSFVHRIFALGKEESANVLAQAAADSPETFTVLALDSPVGTMSGEPPVNGPCVLFLTDEKTRNPVTVHALEWIERLRKGHMNTTAHRFSGMIVSMNARTPSSAHYKLALVYGFMSEVERLLPALATPTGTPRKIVEFPMTSSGEPLVPPTGIALKPNVEFEPTKKREEISTEEIEPLTPPRPETLFDCKTVQTYRRKGTNPNWLKLPNMELILVLGKIFENNHALDRIRKDDPDFVEFYDTLKLVYNP